VYVYICFYAAKEENRSEPEVKRNKRKGLKERKDGGWKKLRRGGGMDLCQMGGPEVQERGYRASENEKDI
jgi:hypothetical protein